MIFGLLYLLVLTNSAFSLLLGSYFLFYTGASGNQLGFLFMIQPFTIFARPFICARADRFQSHKQLLKYCLLGASVAYLPYVILPYLLKIPVIDVYLTFPLRFGILASSHLLGSVFYSGVRALIDVMAVSYAKRVGSDFSAYRKWGTLSFGCCGLLLGQINQRWLLDYVPGAALFCICMSVAFALVHLWPDEFFSMIAHKPLPTGREVISRMSIKLRSTLSCNNCSKDDQNKSVQDRTANQYRLTNWQQLQILKLLLTQDFRIALCLLLILTVGLVGYSPQNFVFTYMKIYCQREGTCDATSLAGISMFAYCVIEIASFIAIDTFRGRLNYVIMLLATFVSLTFHFCFYGFLLEHVSPYFFLVGSLHGLEYAFSIVAALELAYKAAGQVELIIPQLERRGVISKRDDLEVVKVSTRALLVGIYTSCFDGFGVIISSPIFGFLISNYSYNHFFRVVGFLAMAAFATTLLAISLGKCFAVKPKIERIREELYPKVAEA